MEAAERMLKIVKYLCRERSTTMSNLATEYGVSVRTIQRDLVFLSGEMGIPIYCKCGKYEGGVYIDDDYKWDKMYMTAEQINLLIKISVMLQGKLSDSEEILLFQIIKTYSMPTKNSFKSATNCPN